MTTSSRPTARPALRALAPRLLLGLVACLASTPLSAQCTGPTCHVLTGALSDSTTGPLLTGHTYVLDGASTVPTGSTLTIQPGAVVKVRGWYFHAAGVLNALGTAANPIVFTSYQDDTAGGDSNGDGAASSPAPGDWDTLQVYSSASGSVFEHVQFRYGASSVFNGLVSVEGATGVVFDHCSFRDSLGHGLDLSGSAVRVENSHFSACRTPLFDVAYHSVDLLLGNTSANNLDGEIVRLIHPSSTTSVFGDQVWGPANMLNGSDPIVFTNSLRVEQSASLTWQPGTLLKLGPTAGVEVRGRLISAGSAVQPVTVTSLNDHDFGGATGSGNPAPGDWQNINVQGLTPGSEMRHTVMRFGGLLNQGMLRLNEALTLDSCLFEASADIGVLVGGALQPTVVDCLFLDNLGGPISSLPLAALATWSGNQAMGNGGGDVIQIGGTLTSSVTLAPQMAFNGTGTFQLKGSTTISGAGNTLTIVPGVVLKGTPGFSSEVRATSGAKLVIGGPGAQVVLTSIHDDTHGGDTNANGAATLPTPGDWSGVAMVFADHTSTIENTLIRYAGRGLSLVSSNPSVSDSTIELCSLEALRAYDTSIPSLVDCAFNNCGGSAPITELPLDALPGLVNCTASGNAQGNSLRVKNLSPDTALTLGPANTLNGNGIIIWDTYTSLNAQLTLQAGMLLKCAAPVTLNPNKKLICQGTAGAPVVFTSLDDDWGEDSDGSGGAYDDGTPGSWGQLSFSIDSLSSLDHVVVRNAGATDLAGVGLASSSPTLSNLTIERCLGAALSLDTNSKPTLTGCAFDDNARVIDGLNLTHLNGFSGNTASGNGNGDHLRVGWQGFHPSGGWNVQKTATTNSDGILFMGGNWTVGQSQSLTVGPGVVVKWTTPEGRIEVGSSGQLHIAGSQGDPVVLTSIHDDSFGGADGDPTAPQPGDWTGLRLHDTSGAGSTLVEHALIRYAGHMGTPSVDMDNAQATFCFVTIELGAGHGIHTNWNSAPILKNVTIDDHAGGDPIKGITWNVLGGIDGISASGNGSDLDTAIIDSPIVIGDVFIEREQMIGSAIVCMITPATDGTNRLGFGRGVVVKAGLPDVSLPLWRVEGTGLEKAVFTSIYDDTHGGDTNGDGGATQPAPGDWIGINMLSDTGFGGGTAEHALVRYAGAGATPTIPMPGIEAGQIFSCRAEFGAGDGLSADYLLNSVAFMNGGDGISYPYPGHGSYKGTAVNCTSVRNTLKGFTIRKALYCIAWNNGPTGAAGDNYLWVEDIQLCPGCGTDPVYSIGTSVSLSPPIPNHFTNCPNTGWGNLYADPLFVDEAGGDLRLSALSPARNYALTPCPSALLTDTGLCKPTPWGLSGTGYPDPLAGSRDYSENPRAVADSLVGSTPKRADLGAHERVLWSLTVSGLPVLGEDQLLTIQGPPGTALLLAGFPQPAANDFLHPAWGWLMIEPSFLSVLGSLPVGVGLAYSLPAEPLFIGLEIAVQAAVVPSANPTAKQFSNLYRPRFTF